MLKRADVEVEKLKIKTELDRLNRSSKLTHILSEIGRLQDSKKESDVIRRFLFCMNALVEHVRSGGLNRSQFEGIAELAFSLLNHLKISPEKSRLSYLYGEVYLGLSQSYSKDGKHWPAAWHQQISAYLGGVDAPGGEAFQKLSLGLRSWRLGHSRIALDQLDLAESIGLSRSSLILSRLTRIKIHRLLGETYISRQLLASTESIDGLTEIVRAELFWESLLCDVKDSGSILPIIQNTKNAQLLSSPTYLVETKMWTFATAQQNLISRLPKVSYLQKKFKLKKTYAGNLLSFALEIEKCYDDDYPVTYRLKQLGSLGAEIETLATIEKELLVLLAATRWLARSKSFEMAMLTLAEYQTKCFSLTNGASLDCLGLSKDLVDKKWAYSIKLPKRKSKR